MALLGVLATLAAWFAPDPVTRASPRRLPASGLRQSISASASAMEVQALDCRQVESMASSSSDNETSIQFINNTSQPSAGILVEL